MDSFWSTFPLLDANSTDFSDQGDCTGVLAHNNNDNKIKNTKLIFRLMDLVCLLLFILLENKWKQMGAWWAWKNTTSILKTPLHAFEDHQQISTAYELYLWGSNLEKHWYSH